MKKAKQISTLNAFYKNLFSLKQRTQSTIYDWKTLLSVVNSLYQGRSLQGKRMKRARCKAGESAKRVITKKSTLWRKSAF
jgi:hypothetical protein